MMANQNRLEAGSDSTQAAYSLYTSENDPTEANEPAGGSAPYMPSTEALPDSLRAFASPTYQTGPDSGQDDSDGQDNQSDQQNPLASLSSMDTQTKVLLGLGAAGAAWAVIH